MTMIGQAAGWRGWIIFLLWAILACHHLTHAQLITIQVTSIGDAAPNAGQCYPSSQPGLCTLRSAWTACISYSSPATQCVIQMPVEAVIYLNVGYYGALVLSNTANIKVVGNQAVVVKSGSSVQSNVFSPYPSYGGMEDFQAKLRSKDFSDQAIFGSEINEIPKIEDIIAEDKEGEAHQAKVEHRHHIPDISLESVVHTTAASAQFITYSGTSISQSPVLQLLNFTIAYFGTTSTAGGAVSVSGNVTLLVDAMAFTSNVASGGGSIYINRNSYPLRIANSSFFNNYATYGGSIYVSQKTNNLKIAGNSFIANTGSSYGGAVYVTKYNPNVCMDRNYFLNNTAPYGGAIFINNYNDHARITNSMFYNGYAYYGGGFVNAYTFNNYLYMDGNLFHKAGTQSGGGCVFLGFSNYFTTISNNVMEYCSSMVYSGAIHMENDISNTLITDNTFSYNYAYSYGGVMRISGNSNNMQISRNKYYNNFSPQGGSIQVNQDTQHISITDSVFDGNAQALYNRGSDGGAIKLYQRNYNVTIANCVMQNMLTTYGGGISSYTTNHNLVVKDVLIQDCISNSGGGIYLERSHYYVSMANVTVQRCTSYNAGGGILLQNDHYGVRIVNSKLVDNVAYLHGGGLFMAKNNTNVIVAGCNISHNLAQGNGGGIYMLSSNNYFSMMDLEGYHNYAVVQSEHPYQSGKPNSATGSPYVVMTQYINVPTAHEFELTFDPLSYYFQDVLYIYSDPTMTNLLYKTSSFNTLACCFPGVTLPPIVLKGSSLYFVFQNSDTEHIPTSYADNSYGFKVYVTPIITNPTQPTVIAQNSAEYGGGFYQYSQNLNSIIVNSLMAQNTAIYGGGTYLRDANVMFCMYQCQLVQNQASNYGGGVVMLLTHYGSIFHNVTFSQNSAKLYGGGFYADVQNGVGTLSKGNEITLEQCYFEGNIAGNDGGGMYLEDSNLFYFSQSSFVENQASTLNGGGIYAGIENEFTMVQSTFTSNVASSCGGGLASSQGNIITISNTSFQANVATTGGGGICILDLSEFAFSGNILFTQNKAAIGAGIYLSNAQMWSYSNRQQFVLSSNEANFGSAFYFKALIPTATNMEYLTIRNNVARTGGTLYWIQDADMSTAPPGCNSTTNSWVDNQAGYGVQVGTQAVKIVGPASYDVVVYGQSLHPYLSYSLEDHYGSFIPLNGSTTFYPTINASADSRCFGFFPYLSGSDTLGNGISVQSGLATFTALQVNCAPNGSVSLSVQALLGVDMGIPTAQASSYYLSIKTQLQFRNCSRGEYAKNGQCFVCPKGSYSLIANAVTCTECSSVSGIDSCVGEEIVVANGYWRRYPDTAAVMSCLYPDNCAGGNITGDGLCAEGSSGPLCSVCSEGYYLDGSVCVACSGGSVFNPTLIAFMVIFGILVLVGLLIYCFYDSIFHSAGDSNKNAAQTKRPQSANAGVHIEMQSKGSHSPNLDDEAPPPPSFSTIVVTTEIEQAGDEEDRELSYWELTWLWLQCKYGQIMVKVKIVVSTFQVVMSSTEVLSVSFPAIFTTWMNSFSFLNFSLSKIFPLGCSESYSFIETLVLTTLAPIALAITIFIAFAGEYQYRNYMLRNQENKEKARLEMYETVRDKYLNYFFYLTYLVLPSVTTTIFQMYLCTNVDPDGETPQDTNYYLTADMNISCDSDLYYDGVVYASCMILVYPIGIPAMYLYLLYQNRHELLHRNDSTNFEAETTNGNDNSHADSIVTDNPLLLKTAATNEAVTLTTISDSPPADAPAKELSSSASRLAFLWEAYLPEFWYWEVIETTRRLVLTAVLSVCATGTSEQSVLSILLAVVYIKIYSLYNPYADASGNILAETGQYQIFFTFFCSMVISNQLVSSDLSNLIGTMLVLVNLGVIALSFYFELVEYYEEDFVSKEEQEAEKIEKEGDYSLRALVLRLKSVVYGDHRQSPKTTARPVLKATSKATAMYLQARQRTPQSRQSEHKNNHRNMNNADNLPPPKVVFTRVEETSSIKQIVKSVRNNQDSDDEDGL